MAQLICPSCNGTEFDVEFKREVTTIVTYTANYSPLHIHADDETLGWGTEAEFDEDSIELPNGDVIHKEFTDTVDEVRNKLAMSGDYDRYLTDRDDDKNIYLNEEDQEDITDSEIYIDFISCSGCGSFVYSTSDVDFEVGWY